MEIESKKTTIKDSIWSVFDSSFQHIKKKRIAIYGIGENTQLILEKATDYNIVGLLDGVKDSGIVYGLPLMKLIDLTADAVDLVIIIARSSNIGVILNRIANQCVNHGIGVYNIQGMNLLESGEEEDVEYQYVPDRDAILAQVDSSEYVSFDIFDTLIMRRVLFPTDIFEMMSVYDESLPEDFSKVREACERSFIVEQRQATIYDIYTRIQSVYQWDDTRTAAVMELEITTDIKTIIARKDMIDIYQYALSRDKKVYLISDMYYTADIIERILEGVGVQGYTGLYVSCQFGTSKSEKLFDIYLSEADSGKKLHIGDDENADIIPARARGMNTAYVPSARWMLQHSKYAKMGIMSSSLLEKAIVGLYISRMFNSPFNYEKGRGQIDSKVDYGYMHIGPLVLKICLWLIENLYSTGKKSILFAARDGYIIKQAFDYICELAGYNQLQSIYLYASRMAYVCMSLYDEEDIRFAYELAYDGSIEQMLKERFKLSYEDIKPYVEGAYEDKWAYMMAHKDRILAVADSYRQNFRKYIHSNNIDIEEGAAYFDFVSSGTCHRSLQRIVGAKLGGYYVSYIYSKYTEGLLDVEELFHNEFGCVSEQFICNHYLFLENILTSYEPTLKEFDTEGQVLFLDEERTEDMITEVKEIHQGIMEFIKDIAYLMNGKLKGKYDKNIPDKLFSYILKRYTRYNVNMQVNGLLVDAFCRRTLNADDILGELKVEG